MSEKKIPYKIYLEENEMPTQWYNVRADMKNKPAPLLNPASTCIVSLKFIVDLCRSPQFFFQTICSHQW